jgi:hypothetical protein
MPWSISIGKVTGTSHIRSGKPCQDDALARWVPTAGALILAVSDGAGSGMFTHVGAAVAVRSCCYYIESRIASGTSVDTNLLKEAAKQAQADLALLHTVFSRASENSVTPRDLATTLLVVVIYSSRLLMLQIGDGAIVVNSHQRLQCLSPLIQREYVNITTFLTDEFALTEAHVCDIDAHDIDSVAVMSDGVQHLSVSYPSNEPFPDFFVPVFRYAHDNTHVAQDKRFQELQHLLDKQDVNMLTDDDKTLVIAVRY